MINPLVSRQSAISTFLLHKSATVDQIDANKISNSVLKFRLLKNSKSMKTGCMVAPQQLSKQYTCFLGHLVLICLFQFS